MNTYPNVERRDTGPAWMDKTATSEEQILRERAEIWREQEVARVQPAIDAIRNIPQRDLTKDAAIAIVMALSCRINGSTWARTEAGDTATGALDELAADLEVL